MSFLEFTRRKFLREKDISSAKKMAEIMIKISRKKGEK